MTNDKRSPKSQCRKDSRRTVPLWISSFVIHSSFVIRHSAFAIGTPHPRLGRRSYASTMAEKFRYIGNRGHASAWFPLTPALSLRERENRRPSVGEYEVVGTFERCALFLPLPEGEGRGENSPKNFAL